MLIGTEPQNVAVNEGQTNTDTLDEDTNDTLFLSFLLVMMMWLCLPQREIQIKTFHHNPQHLKRRHRHGFLLSEWDTL